ncbi:protein KBP homolog isoform X1 [Formica exsecta]|uniref:protein KBP homolog isoform X1 n=1 Tax=Formica exsecta TaxID=72781 RepID=UPI0011430855|nr:protein KBP homolog isoform X1 [Formica exsecta]
MLAIVEYFIKRRINESSQSADARSLESVEHMDVNKRFLEVLKSSFDVKNLYGMNKLSKKKKKMIKTIEARMDDLFQYVTNVTSTNVTFDDIIVLAIAYFNIGLAYADCTDEKELYAGKNYFMRCIKLLEGKELERKAILTAIRVLIELRCVLIKLQKPGESKPLLDKAMELYLKYTEEKNKYLDPINVSNILGIEEESNFQLSLDKLHLITVDQLVKQYHLWPKDKDRLVIYIHNLLNRQILETLECLDIECYYWALASVDLSQYFISKHCFTEARHHLAAADYVMERFHKDKLMTIDKTTYSESIHASMFDKYQHVCANTARFWGFYGIALLRLSKEKLCQENDKSCETDDSKSESLINPEKKSINFLLFADLEKDLENITSQIADTYVLNLNDAKVVFVNVLRWLDIAKSYFTIEKNFGHYGKIIIEISKAYKYFAYFEQSKVKQIKICKLRIEILENAIKELYIRAKRKEEFLICKHIHFELGIAYSAFSDMKTDKLDDETLIMTVEYDAIFTEIHQSVKNAIEHFKLYLNI